VVSYLQPLDKGALKRILTEPKNAIVKQFVRLFELDGIKLTFTDQALSFIVEKSIEYKLGARGLRSIMEAILNEAMFELPDNKELKEFKVTRPYAAEKLENNSIAKLRVA
jgi:ATP-dependent Clp protease ATP-binding subunit ClpX